MMLQLAEPASLSECEVSDIPKYFVRLRTAPSTLIREDLLDEFSDDELMSEGVELSRGGKKRRDDRRKARAKKKEDRNERKKVKAGAKADLKKDKGEAKIKKADAKIVKAQGGSKGFDIKGATDDLIDTAGNAFTKYKEIKNDLVNPSDDSVAPNEDDGTIFGMDKKTVAIGAVLTIGTLFYLSSRKQKRAS